MLKNLLLTTALLALAASAVTAQTVYYNHEFDGGLDGWTTNSVAPTDTNLWVWSPDGDIQYGGLTYTPSVLVSPTVNNGCAIFHADFETTGGDLSTVGDPPYPEYWAELISPPIDLSASSSAVSVRFSQFYSWLNLTDGAPNAAFIEYSLDGGMTWETDDRILLNENVPIRERFMSTETVPVPNIAQQPNVALKFVFATDFYFWALDDIQVVSRANNDLRVQENFYAIAPNLQTPTHQVEEMTFLADIINLGGAAQTGTTLSMDITDGTGMNIYNGSFDFGTIAPDSLAENQTFGGFTPPAVVDTYTGTYTLTSDSVDVTPENNTISFDFQVTDSTFAKELGATRAIYPAAGNWDTGEFRSWAYGNVYHVVNSTDADGNQLQIGNVSFSLVGTPENAGQLVNITVYEWSDGNADGNVDPDERTQVGFAGYIIDAAQTQNNVVSVEILDLNTDQPVLLRDNTNYVAMIEFRTETEIRVDFGGSEAVDYAAMVLTSEQSGAPRFAGVLGIAGDLDTEPYSSVGFGRDLVPVVRMVTEPVPMDTTSTTNLLPTTALELSPNPTVSSINAKIDLPEAGNQVFITVFNANGQLMESRDLGAVRAEDVTLDVSDYAAGKYYFFLQVDRNSRLTKTFIKQ